MERGSCQGKRRIALLVQYDGTGFIGWQVQDDGRSVQGDIEKAIEILTKEKCRTIAAGRTDTGVHAIGQVVHFNTSSALSLSRLCIGLNGIMGRDVSVVNAYNVPDSFHSRYSAVEREYIYRIYNSPQRSPFMLYRSMWVMEQLDQNYCSEAAQYLVGEHDFASFCKKKSAEGGTIRRINGIEIIKSGNYIDFIIRGNAFLHNMIRIIVGTIVGMNRTGEPPENILSVLGNHNRDSGGVTAPPYGLYLNKITYDPPLSDMESAF